MTAEFKKTRIDCIGTQLPGFTRDNTYRALYIVPGFRGFVAVEWTSRDANVAAVALASRPKDLRHVDYSSGYFGYPVSHDYAVQQAINLASNERKTA